MIVAEIDLLLTLILTELTVTTATILFVAARFFRYLREVKDYMNITKGYANLAASASAETRKAVMETAKKVEASLEPDHHKG